MKKIGLIGGAGPEAGALLLKKVIQQHQKNGSWEDHHFPRIMLLSYNFSPMLESNENKTSIINELQSAVDIINNSQNDVVSIACNTLHSFVKNIDFKDLKFLSIIDAVTDEITNQNMTKILFLGTKTSVHTKIYENTDSIQIMYPHESQQDLVHNCIVRILKNQHSAIDSIVMGTIINECHNTMNFAGVILGCTELSVLHQDYSIVTMNSVKIFDPIDILAKKLAFL